jgi:outer membrane protein assembly factor BamB
MIRPARPTLAEVPLADLSVRLPKCHWPTYPLQLETGGPVVFDADRRLSNVAREFAAAVAQEDWPDAQRTVARHLAESGVAAASQLIRHPDDPDRMVTLPVLVAATLRDHPAYRDALQGDAADRGRLRMRSVAAAGDAKGMEVAAVEFAGTPAAAEAHEWLAARAMAAGDIAAAREHAVAGRAWADADTAGRLVSIEALAEALGSAGVRTKPQAGLPDAPAADIAAVVAQAPARSPVAEQPPPPGDLEATKRLDLDASPAKEGYSSHADSLRNPIDERLYVFIAPPFFRQRLDWGAEVCTIAAAPGRLLVNNRIELVSLDPATAAVQWRLPPGPKSGGLDSLGPGLVAMRPCCDDRHAYLRRLAHGNAPTVAAVRLADGTVAWESTATAPHPPISDPVLVDGGLQFFELRPGVTDELTFVVVDPISGARRMQKTVGVVQSGWRVRRAKYDERNIESGDCQVTAADGRLYVTIGGSVFCCDADGQLRWTRHLPWLAADVDGWWRYQAQTPPLVHDGRVFLIQPGFPGIAAVDAADGQLLWKQPLEGPRRLVGIAGAGAAARLVVETAEGILACDPRDGSTRMLLEARDGPGDFWLGIAPTRLVGPPLATADGHVIAMVQQRRADTAATGVLDVAVVWVDVATGGVQKTAEVPSLAGKPPWAGPLAVAEGRLWTLAFANAADMRRALWELAPKPAP